METNNDEITVPRAQLQSLLNENKQMKEDIREGAELFKHLTSVTGLNDGINLGTLTLKIPKLIHTFQKNPEIIEKLTLYVKKIQKYLPDESTGTKQIN